MYSPVVQAIDVTFNMRHLVVVDFAVVLSESEAARPTLGDETFLVLSRKAEVPNGHLHAAKTGWPRVRRLNAPKKASKQD